TLVSERIQNISGGKQKIGSKAKNNKKGGKFQSSKARSEEQEKMRRLRMEVIKKTPLTVKIPEEIVVAELASRMKKTGAEVIKSLVKNGVMASINETIDFDTAEFVATELGCKVEREVTVTIEEKIIDDHVDTAEELQPRSPVVVVMGHVDHGKTSLLDAVRKTNVVSGEAGGITQHIGAYTVQINGNPITFLDTPGHAAFTSMRARGAMCTDIAILVVAADDGIMPQTVEAINHAKAAKIPIIVAINKMDKHGANPDRIKQQLTEYDLVPEEWGGDTVICPISAKTGQGIDELLEMVILTSEVQELKANPNRAAKGTVIEARLDRTRGPIATLLIQNGTLNQGDVIIAGTAVGRVRVMTNDKGRTVKTAGPSVPVEITGLADVPAPGDEFNAVSDERMARELVEQRRQAEKDAAAQLNTKITLDNLFAMMQEGEMKDLNLIVKADVQGSAEALKASLLKLSNDEVRVKVIHTGVGAVNESDILLASTANAIIIGFNVRPDAAAQASAQRAKVDVRMYRVIYDAINEIEAALKGMLAPKYQEVVIGHAEVRQTYKVSAIGTIAGCYVKDGKVTRDAQVRVLRDHIVLHQGAVGSLQRFKDSVKEVTAGYECGMSIDRFNDIKEGDVFECFAMEEIKQ
ncbi:MAG: translation initiation factor IF-2, partial [Oscillospiraceae bacterium]